jgi:hypothetical protein
VRCRQHVLDAVIAWLETSEGVRPVSTGEILAGGRHLDVASEQPRDHRFFTKGSDEEAAQKGASVPVESGSGEIAEQLDAMTETMNVPTSSERSR